MKIKLLILSFAVLFALTGFSQFVETEINTSKGLQKGIKIQVDSLNKEISFQALTDYFLENNPDKIAGFTSAGEIYFQNVIIKTISEKPSDILGVFDTINQSFIILLYNDSRFINSNNSLSEYQNFQGFGILIKKKIAFLIKQKEKEVLKSKIAVLEKQKSELNSQLKYLNKDTKTDIKGAKKDDRTIENTNQKLASTEREKQNIQNSIVQKEKEINEFPLNDLNAEIKAKNKLIKSNQKNINKLSKKNYKHREKLMLLSAQKIVNDSQKVLYKDQTKELKKLDKASYKLIDGINEIKNETNANNDIIAKSRIDIVNDSLNVANNQNKIDLFDMKGKQKELKKLKKSNEKLAGKANKQKEKIDNTQTEADLKRKEAEEQQKKIDVINVQINSLDLEIEAIKVKLKQLEK